MSMELQKLLAWRDLAGPLYGSEDQALFLYSLVKMYRPRTVVELGAGLGVSSFWIAQALRENGDGRLFSVDDGCHWQECVIENPTPKFTELLRQIRSSEEFSGVLPEGRVPGYFEFLRALAALFGVDSQVSFVTARLDLSSLLPKSDAELFSRLPAKGIDLLYSDFSHGPYAVLALLCQFLPRMAESASILIDSASTQWQSYLVLEQTLMQLNAGKVPAALLAGADRQRRETVMEIVATRKFSLSHMIERKDRAQNGLAWIKMEPVNVVPYPLTAMRAGDGKLTPTATIQDFFQQQGN